MPVKIASSILSADFLRLGEQIQEVENAGTDWIHIDVMDGLFVPNITIGAPIVRAIRPISSLPLDVHLMIERPEAHIPEFAGAGADCITVHVETCPHLHRTIEQIKAFGIMAGVTLNPSSPLLLLEEILPFVDLVLIMSVNPGFGGQSYISTSTAKIGRLRKMLEDRQLERVEIQVDGGVKPENAAEIVDAGATVLVAGSAIFNQKNSIEKNISELRAGFS